MILSPNSVVAITGASSGIGRALALELAPTGAWLALLARRTDRLAEVAAEVTERGGRPLVLCCNVAVRAEVHTAFHHILRTAGPVDVLVNNAGSGHCAYVEDTPDEQIEEVMGVNVNALWYTATEVLPGMRRRGAGVILTVSSLAGVVGYPANAVYVAAKHAALGFTRALRAELYGSGVEACVVLPAGTLTDWSLSTAGGPIVDLFNAEAERGIALARERGIEPPPLLPLLEPQDVARIIAATIRTPQPEVYTHPGSEELVRLYNESRQEFERRMGPWWQANREAYRNREAREK